MFLTGLHTFRVFLPKSQDDERLLSELEKHYSEGTGEKFMDRCAHMIIDQFTRKNLTTTVGRTWLASVICDTSTRTNNFVTHFAIGDDTTPAAQGDTTLGNELFRKAVSSRAEDGATANISTFLAANEANFQWQEYGHFIDASMTKDSGVMLTHYLDATINKASPTTVTVDTVLTLSNA
jgi:hypothetical protein